MVKKIKIAFTTLLNDPTIFLYFCLSFIYNVKIPPLLTLSSNDLISELKKGKSLIRVGDGEAMLCMGRSIHYQSFTDSLQLEIKTIITTYTQNSPYILAVPYFAIQNSVAELKEKKRFRIWRLFRVFFKIRFNHDVTYADAVMFYHQNAFTDLLSSHLKNKQVIVVTKSDNLTQELRNTLSLFSSHAVKYVTAPDTNTYEKLSQILTTIDTLRDNTLPEKLVILVAAGPAAKSITWHYAKLGIQTLDIGHGIEIIGKKNDYSDRL